MSVGQQAAQSRLANLIVSALAKASLNLSFTYLPDDIDRYACFCYNRNDRILRREIKVNGMHNK